MLVCISGLPGHGKTLYTLHHVEALRRESGRPVYFHGITDLNLPWLPLDEPKEWEKVPDGSIVVIDEAWKTFPKRSAGAAVPPFVQALATHRHRGLDIFLVTQHPLNQLDHFVRGLVGRHYHVRRVFGSQRSRLYTWEELGDPKDYHSLKVAVASWFTYPKEVFTWYKSAEVHTVKRQIPAKPFLMIGGGILAVGLLGWLAFAQLSGSVDRATGAATEAQEALPNALPGMPGSRPPGLRASFSAESFVPSVPGMPFTSPFYQDAVKVSDVPIVSGCGVLKVGARVDCRCNDQQGNKVQLEHRHCLALFEAGQFQPGRSSRYPEIAPYVPTLPGPSVGEAPGDQPQAGAGDSALRSKS